MAELRTFARIKARLEKTDVRFNNLGKSDPFYNSKAWKRLRKAYFTANPNCEIEGCLNCGHTVDHPIPISEGGEQLSWTNLMTLCKKHNLRKTGRQAYYLANGNVRKPKGE
jgi:5-methylcytosine-specific restriction endonuclease McrA